MRDHRDFSPPSPFSSAPPSRVGSRRALISLCAAFVAASVVSSSRPRALGDAPRAALAAPASSALARLAQQGEVIDNAAALIRERQALATRQRDRFATAAVLALMAADRTAPLAAMPSLATARQRAYVAFVLGRYHRDLGASTREAARMQAARAALDERTAEITKALASPKTKLRWPAAGPIVAEFGSRYDEAHRLTLARRGVELNTGAVGGGALGSTALGSTAVAGTLATIIAPGDATVRYAGPLPGLRQIVMLDHGDVLTVIGDLETLAVRTGEYIARSAPIGQARGRIYMEVRLGTRAGMPVDPRPYFVDFPSK